LKSNLDKAMQLKENKRLLNNIKRYWLSPK